MIKNIEIFLDSIKNYISNPLNIALWLNIIAMVLILIVIINYFFKINLFNLNIQDRIEIKKHFNLFKKNFWTYYSDFINKVVQYRIKNKWINNSYNIKEYEILLARANKTLTPISTRPITWLEYSSINVVISIILTIFFIIFIIFNKNNLSLTYILIYIVILIYINVIRIKILEFKINNENIIISNYFNDFFLCQYHILIAKNKNPLTIGLNIYKYKTNNKFMINWVNDTLYKIDISNEEQVIKEYKVLYKNIQKLIRFLNIEEAIIRGGEVDKDLNSIRQEIFDEKRLQIEINAQKILKKLLIIRIIVFIIVIQACIGLIIFTFLSGNGTQLIG